jgi:DNA-binding response OmpR family regulator
MRVLVIDDESVTRRVVTHALKTIGVEVIGAENAAQGLELASESSFMLALVDINLPDLDGFSLVSELKKLPHMQETPIIVFTARSHPGDEDKAEEVGADGFFYKPFSTQELRGLVKKHT